MAVGILHPPTGLAAIVLQACCCSHRHRRFPWSVRQPAAMPTNYKELLPFRRCRATSARSVRREFQEPGAGVTLAASWPGLALIALGAILLLVGAASSTSIGAFRPPCPPAAALLAG
jgi:hypothetical protein